VTSIAFPQLGTQNGKLSWDEIGPLMQELLQPLELDVRIYTVEASTIDAAMQTEAVGDAQLRLL
jgi:hypothetical protein